MDTTAIIIIVAIVAVLAIAAAAAWMSSRKNSHQLADRFGPEYDRVVEETGKKSAAERELREREQRVQKLKLEDLSPAERQSFVADWRFAQEKFVDDPAKALSQVNSLVEAVMDKRGYPVKDFDQQAADISVDHPQVVTNYRAAHTIAVAHEQSGVSTEELRQAMIHYRALFEELVEATPVRS